MVALYEGCYNSAPRIRAISLSLPVWLAKEPNFVDLELFLSLPLGEKLGVFRDSSPVCAVLSVLAALVVMAVAAVAADATSTAAEIPIPGRYGRRGQGPGSVAEVEALAVACSALSAASACWPRASATAYAVAWLPLVSVMGPRLTGRSQGFPSGRRGRQGRRVLAAAVVAAGGPRYRLRPPVACYVAFTGSQCRVVFPTRYGRGLPLKQRRRFLGKDHSGGVYQEHRAGYRRAAVALFGQWASNGSASRSTDA